MNRVLRLCSGPHMIAWFVSITASIMAPNTCQATYSGQLVSATYDSTLAVGQSLVVTVTVRNTGTSDWLGGSYASWIRKLYWTIGDTTTSHVGLDYATVAAGATSTLTITLTPSSMQSSSPGTYTISLATYYPTNPFPTEYYIMIGAPVSITYTIGDNPEMDVQGNSVSIADGDTTPSLTDHTDFGSAMVDGGTVVRTFTVWNTGTAALNLTGSPAVVVGGSEAAEFTVTTQPSTPIAAGGTTTFQVTFDPAGSGTRNATLSIANNDSDEDPYNFAIRGTGTAPAPEMDVQGNSVSITDGDTTPSLTDHTDFGPALVAAGTVVRTFTVRNTGTATLNLTGNPLVALSGTHAAEFSVTVQPSTPVATGGTTTFQVTFDPEGTGTRSAALSIANDDEDEKPYDFSIQGLGTTPPEMQGPATGAGGTVVIRWSSYTNHLYTVHHSTNLLNGFSVLQSGIPGTPPMNTYTDTVSGADAKFWKVSTQE